MGKTDIRDKPGHCPLTDDGQPDTSKLVIAKEGYYDSNGKKKKDIESSDYYKKIDEINKYFKTSQSNHRSTNNVRSSDVHTTLL